MKTRDFSYKFYTQREMKHWKRKLKDVLEKFPLKEDWQIFGYPREVLEDVKKVLKNVKEYESYRKWVIDAGIYVGGYFDPKSEKIGIPPRGETKKEELKNTLVRITPYFIVYAWSGFVSNMLEGGNLATTAMEIAGTAPVVYSAFLLHETSSSQARLRHEAIHARHFYVLREDLKKHHPESTVKGVLPKVSYLIKYGAGNIGEYLTVIQTYLESTEKKEKTWSGIYAAAFLLIKPFIFWKHPLNTTNPLKAIYRGLKLLRFLKKTYEYLPPWVAPEKLEDFYAYIQHHKKFGKKEKQYLLQVFKRYAELNKRDVLKKGLYTRFVLELSLLDNINSYFKGEFKMTGSSVYNLSREQILKEIKRIREKQPYREPA